MKTFALVFLSSVGSVFVLTALLIVTQNWVWPVVQALRFHSLSLTVG